MHPNGLKLSIVVAAIAVAVLAGAYVYSLWDDERRRREEIPVEAVDSMIRDLRRFHEKQGRFPETFRELEGLVWQPRPREFAADSRGLHHRRYFYIYTRTTNHTFQLWAVPTGPDREDAPTWFVSASPTALRKWKTSALAPEQLTRINPNPSTQTLNALGLIEQPASRPGVKGQ